VKQRQQLIIHKEKSNKILNFIIPYLYEAQNISGGTPSIISAHTVPDNVHQLHVKQPSTYEKPEAASAVLGS